MRAQEGAASQTTSKKSPPLPLGAVEKLSFTGHTSDVSSVSMHPTGEGKREDGRVGNEVAYGVLYDRLRMSCAIATAS